MRLWFVRAHIDPEVVPNYYSQMTKKQARLDEETPDTLVHAEFVVDSLEGISTNRLLPLELEKPRACIDAMVVVQDLSLELYFSFDIPVDGVLVVAAGLTWLE